MKILVIKQTSLGDVLHSTGHVRAIKQAYPDSELVLLTATTSSLIYQHSPWVDKLILIDRYRVKKNWWRHPIWSFKHMRDIMREIKSYDFDLAIDLQGLAKTVLFLYGAHSKKKFVKGNWPGLDGFRNKKLHALKEMDGVLSIAGIDPANTTMEFARTEKQVADVDALLGKINPDAKPIVVLSPYSRWHSKDWPLQNYFALGTALAAQYFVVFSGDGTGSRKISQWIESQGQIDIVNLSGEISMLDFAELVSRAKLMVCGDSFPMHVAVACDTPVVALFGPTDDSKVGPVGHKHQVLIAPNCQRCDRSACTRQCLSRISVQEVLDAVG